MSGECDYRFRSRRALKIHLVWLFATNREQICVFKLEKYATILNKHKDPFICPLVLQTNGRRLVTQRVMTQESKKAATRVRTRIHFRKNRKLLGGLQDLQRRQTPERKSKDSIVKPVFSCPCFSQTLYNRKFAKTKSRRSSPFIISYLFTWELYMLKM